MNLELSPAHGLASAAWLLIALPFASSLVLIVGGKRLDKVAHWIGALVPVALFGYTIALFFAVKGQSDRHVDLTMFTFIPVAGFHVDAGLLLDPLAITFALLITGVGGAIHVYAVGYMADDPGRRRFFGYFNFFVAAMLLLVLADNYLVLYVGWECVGLASYLLISFYFSRDIAATAGNKAFYMNRVGDVGLSIAIMIMFAYCGTTSFSGVFEHFGASGNAGTGVAAALCITLLIGACSKSGQVPLQAWLPDAMEGPTPVSALIHAATMVTAGVYLIARSAVIFDASQAGRTLVVIVGAATILYGCISAFGQDDLKKVLAYSTISQIGYMFLAVGLGSGFYAYGIIHLLGHGFFKAVLFLTAGSVMHAMGGRIDMRRFGGLAKVMPITYGAFFCGYLAIIGCPPFTGFFTKDKIIEVAYDKGGISGYVLGSAALLGAALTAAYMTRALLMTFHGKRRWEDDVHPHEAKPVMTVPMVLLGVASLVGGYLLVRGNGVGDWLSASFGAEVEPATHTVPSALLTVIGVVVMLIGVGWAWLVFGRRDVPERQPLAVSPITVVARKNVYGDAFNEAVFMRPGQWLSRALVFFDNRGVDGAVNGLAALFGGGSGRLRRLQTGFVRSYALSMLGGSVAVVALLLAVRF